MNEKKNILIINYEYPPLGGGGGVFAKALAEELVKENNVDVLTSHYKGLKKKEIINGVNIFRVPVLCRSSLNVASFLSLISFVPSAIINGTKILKKRKYDVINTHFAVPTGPVGIFFSKLLNIPNVLSLHGGDIYNPSKKISPHRHNLLRMLVRKVMENSTEVIAQSTNTKSNALDIYCPSKNIHIIPLGIPKPFIAKTSRKELGLKEEATYIISIGNFTKTKGYNFLIGAMEILKDKYPKLNLLLLGDGPEYSPLVKLSCELNVEDRICFVGSVHGAKKFEYISVSNLYVLSSIQESFGISIIEAMCYGLPIIATNSGGPTDIIKDDINGYIVKPCDKFMLAKAIDKMLSDSSKIESFSLKNIKDFDMYEISVATKRYMDLFNEVIQRT